MIKLEGNDVVMPVWLNTMIKNGVWSRLVGDPNDFYARSYLFNTYRIPSNPEYKSVLEAVRKIQLKIREAERMRDAGGNTLPQRINRMVHHGTKTLMNIKTYNSLRAKVRPNLPEHGKIDRERMEEKFRNHLPFINVNISESTMARFKVEATGDIIVDHKLQLHGEEINDLRELIVRLFKAVSKHSKEECTPDVTSGEIQAIARCLRRMFTSHIEEQGSERYRTSQYKDIALIRVPAHEINLIRRNSFLFSVTDILRDCLSLAAKCSRQIPEGQEKPYLVREIVQEACASDDMSPEQIDKEVKSLSSLVTNFIQGNKSYISDLIKTALVQNDGVLGLETYDKKDIQKMDMNTKSATGIPEDSHYSPSQVLTRELEKRK